MNILKNSSIRRKQSLIVMLTSGSTLLLACVAFVIFEMRVFRQGLVDDVAVLAEVVGNNCAAALEFDDPLSAAETLGALRANESIVSAVVYGRNGDVFAEYRRNGEAVTGASRSVREAGHKFVRNRLKLYRLIERRDERSGAIFVVSDLSGHYLRIKQFAAMGGVVFAASLALAFLLARSSQRFLAGPILELVRAAREVTEEKNYTVRAKKQSEDELGVLVDAFNEMLGRIEARDADLRTAHDELELRVAERTAALNRAEAESAREHQRLKFIFNSVPVGIALRVVGPDGASTNLVNDAQWRICGVGHAEQREFDFNGLTHPDDRVEQDRLHRRLEAGETGHYSLEKRYLCPDGRTVWVYFAVQRRLVETGGYEDLSTVVDVTELKKAQQEGAYERDLLRVLLDNSPDYIYFKDLNSRFLMTSRFQARKFGKDSSGELEGKSDFDFFSERHAREAFEDEQRIIRTGEPIVGKVERESWENRADELWVLTSKLPLRNSEGEIIGTFGISRDITNIKEAEAKLEKVHRQLLETSRQAGMAEVATSVLHNVGNVLNTVNISASTVSEKVKQSRVRSLAKVVALLRENRPNLAEFIANDPKGKQLPDFLAQLSEYLESERETVVNELDSLQKNIEHIKEIIAMQQSYARVSGVAERVAVSELVEDSLGINGGALHRHGVELVREFEEVPAVTVERHKVLQILVNLIRNAKYACDETGRSDKRITVRVTHDEETVQVSVADNGIGISADNLNRIFSHGFTTRPDGHGFGLHSSALVAGELGGSLSVQSEGENRGSTFTLTLPVESSLART